VSRSVFDPVAQRYDASRPGYPDALFAAIESRARPLAGATVVEVGAGTGKATRELIGRGARVLPVDIGAGMLAQLRSRLPGVPAVVGDGIALPVQDGAADLVACAQAFHWLPLDRSLPEAVRVLRPGGAIALWWNVSEADDEPWMRRLGEQFRATPSGSPGQEWPEGVEGPLRATGLVERVERVDLRWEWRVPLESYLGYVGSKSAVVRLEADAEAFLDEQRRELAAAFPGGMVTEPFTCRLTLAWPR
jgi:SAM-dependent methyltransferase